MTTLDTRPASLVIDPPAVPAVEPARLRAALLVAGKLALGVLVTLAIGEVMTPVA